MSESSLQLELILHPSVAAVVDAAGATAFRERLIRRVGERVEAIGLTTDVQLAMRSDGERAVEVRASERPLPYPPPFLRRLWYGFAPPDLRAAADGAGSGSGFRDGWLIACAEKVLADGHDHGLTAIAGMVEQVVIEVIKWHAAALVTSEEAAGILCSGSTPVLEDPEDACRLLASLVDLGVTLPSHDDLRGMVRGMRATGRSVPD